MGGIIMKQFTLEEYLKNPSLKVVTRDGRPARIVCTNVKGKYPVIGLILYNDQEEFIYNFTENGRWSIGIKSDRDLFFLEQEYTSTSKNNEKFDPKTLKSFDKVLVFNAEGMNWQCSLFSHYNEEDASFPFVCIDSFCYQYCIPYNDDTKYLIGTTKEVPEYYRYWK